ncbi:MAG TPA: L,D-transpeptidase family protein [Candidatus Nitrosotalea sp.]|nr:L,D-transpeptidase family protein [Candidatus Nitrosotalea sp.]
MKTRVFSLIAIVLILALGAAGAYGYSLWRTQTKLYSTRAQELTQQISAYRAAGYAPAELDSIQAHLNQLGQTPIWVQLRPDNTLADQVSALQSQLRSAEAAELASDTSAADSAVGSDAAEITTAQQLGAVTQYVAPLAAQLALLQAQRAKATTPAELATVVSQAAKLKPTFAALVAQQTAANSAIQQAASQLLGQSQSNPAAIASAGQQSRANGRNDATVASYEAEPGRFAQIGPLMDVYYQMESYDTDLSSSDVHTAALGAAAMAYYSAQIHQLLLAGLGPQHLIVSFTAQHVWAYQNGTVVMNSPVTTGVRGVTDVGTDFGPMKVMSKDSPWTFVSPWPKGSPYWYPNTKVNYSTFFTDSGESFHDAYWEPDSLLGPGSQYNASTESHGCVHVPLSVASWIYRWAQIGTPVDVYPGDGSPVSVQLGQITTTAQGAPLNPA